MFFGERRTKPTLVAMLLHYIEISKAHIITKKKGQPDLSGCPLKNPYVLCSAYSAAEQPGYDFVYYAALSLAF
jgi:hypothetical protein